MSGEFIPNYLKSSEAFIAHRLAYSNDHTPITTGELRRRVFPQGIPVEHVLERQEIVERLGRGNEEVIVVTATKNRPQDIAAAYDVMDSQTMRNWSWVVVDNGDEPLTEEVLKRTGDARVKYFKFSENGGCAFPARNAGLDILHLAKVRSTGSPFVAVVDSDDRLFDGSSLHEMLRIANSESFKKNPIALIHGFSATEIRDPNSPTIRVPNPRDLGSDFPRVNNLKEVFDKGLNILAGMFPIELLSVMRYPKEFSFEDDGFNQKLLLEAKRRGMVWVADAVPATIKVFHQESMSGTNNQIGNTSESGKIGLHRVTGIRAKIVSYLHDITDYYTQEEL